MIKKVTEDVEITKIVKESFPVWTGFADDQQVRYNKTERRFQVRMSPSDEWEPMEWEGSWLGGGLPHSEIRDVLVNLLALMDATVPPKKKNPKKA